ncbi:DUF3592 domain-containing protein [Luteimicrobium xylanilyticum]|uniref:DUF3592 domain-containing protein n=1 Tax=Luteimicrobium xylanilyticum TaxID=1133546 RepID=A0A5P9Q6D9_9MICO|nr:DUF3592 domain-containing protein [Luteimicrobium xylanilyticum]QFU96967.1 hypothetical protein KDY119_00459 [Luteimicrobium xylanilyticum]
MRIAFVVVPALVALVLLWMIVGAVREISAVRALQRSGQESRGTVVASHVSHSTTGTGDDRRVSSTLVETVEFPTLDGRRIRAVPTYSDIGMLDRSGQDVRVLYDPERPERFIAPSGARMGTGSAGVRVVVAIVFLVLVGGFVVFSQSLLNSSPF